MKAILLAAGVGNRLYGSLDGHPHKALLQFGGQSLLARHLDVLEERHVDELVLVVGYRATDLLEEIRRMGAADFVKPVVNDDFRRGSLLSLWCARGALEGGSDVLIMDADVLYHPGLIDRLCDSPHRSCIPLDRGFEPGNEPVKVRVRNGIPVEFGKEPAPVPADTVGEWPGFLKLEPGLAARLVAIMGEHLAAGRLDAPMEDAVRDLLLRSPGEIGCEDVTGVPWIEIDFREDVARAEREVLPLVDRGRPRRRSRRVRSLGAAAHAR